MDTISRQISSIAEEARSRKLLSVILAFILATTLMVPHTAWAEGDEGGEGAQTTGVAKIGDTPYDTLQAAIDKAQADDAIVLTADTTESVTIAKEKSVTIDLGGCKLTNVDGKHTITNNGTLTVKGTGTVDNVSHARAALENVEGATAVLDGGAYTRSQENGQSSTDAGGNSFYVIRNHGALTINDGVDVSQNGHYSSMIENGYQNAGAEKKDPESVPSLTIAGGTFAGGLNTVKNDDCGVLEITGGTFTNVSQAVLLNWNVAKVSGGVFTATESSDGVILNGMNPGEINKGDLTITGGTFTAAADAEVISQMGGSTGIGTISISGGTYSATVEDFCAEGYSCTLVDGAYVVNETPAPVVAKIGNDEYASLKEAAEKAVAGDVVELLTDVESEPIAFENNVTVDLGAKTLTIVGDDAGTVDGLLFAGAGDNALKNGTVIDARSNGNQTAGWKAVHVSGAANLATENVAIQAYKPDTESNYNYLIYVGGKGDSKAKAVSLDAGTKLENLDNTASTSAVTYGAVGVALIGTTSDASAVAEKVSLTVAEGVVIDTMGYAISGNGTFHGTDIVINGGDVKSTASAAVYHPQAGTLVLNGGTLEGTTGIQFCSGEGTVNTSFDFNGGVVKGVGEDERPGKTGDGLVSDGAAISLVNRSYPGGAPSITINGGEFSSVHNEAVLAYTWSKGRSSDWAEASENISIAGGTYSSDVSAYVIDGLACSKISDGVYQIQKKIEGGDGNVEVQAPVVSGDNVPADKPGVPEDDEALSTIADSLSDAIKADEPAKDGAIGGNKIETGKDSKINDLVKDADAADVSATMVVSSIPVAAGDVDPDEADAIKGVAAENSAISFYDLSVKLVVSTSRDSVEAKVTETAAAIPFQIKVEDGLVGKDVQVVRYHDGKAEVLDGVEADYATNVVSFAGDKFSTYAVVLADAVEATVTFDCQGGSAVEKATVDKGDYVAEPAVPTYEGYTFGGWYTDKSCAEDTKWDFESDRVTGDMTLYALWTKNATPVVPTAAARLGGDDRYKTMELISQESFPTAGSCETVIIARGNDFPDALAASALAGAKDAQVLITESNALTAETKAEIKRLGAKNAIVLGDKWSISENTFNEIKALMSGTTTRIGGADRLETAYEIYKSNAGNWGKTAIVATGEKAADSLSISSVAYALEAPIFLAAKDGTVSQDVLDALSKGGFERVVVLGDEWSVSDDSVASIKKVVSNTERLGGVDRYETSQMTAEWAVKNCSFDYSNAMLTAGRDDKYADALVSSSLGGKNASPLLLIDEGEPASFIISKVIAPNKDGVEKAYVLGDKWTVSDDLFAAIEKALA